MTQALVPWEGIPPQSIGIVGMSGSKSIDDARVTEGLGFFRSLRNSGFKGRIYPVNPKAKEIAGVKAYPSVASVPERLDLVIVVVPAALTPQVLEDCAAAEVRNVQIATSGFAESGLEEGERLENTLREIATRHNIRVIGPNCMGFHIPSANLSTFGDFKLVRGPVGYLSQSAGHIGKYLHHGPELGIGFSKAISYGNALTIDATELLEHFYADPETEVICVYLEGIRDGRRFTELVREVTPVKPVIILKGGLTEAGARAASSHTASLGGSRQIWDAFFEQTHAIRVNSIEEMAEATMTYLRVKALAGARLAVIGGGGGESVTSADICTEEGVDVPALSLKTQEALMEFIPLVNQFVKNPLDIAWAILEPSVLRRTLEILNDEPVIDVIALVVDYNVVRSVGCSYAPIAESIRGYSDANPDGKPVVCTVPGQDSIGSGVNEQYLRDMRALGITTYGSLRTTCRAMKRLSEYHSFVSGNGKRSGTEEA